MFSIDIKLRMIITAVFIVVWVLVNHSHVLLGEAIVFMLTVLLVSDLHCWIIPLLLRSDARTLEDKILILENLDDKGLLSKEITMKDTTIIDLEDKKARIKANGHRAMILTMKFKGVEQNVIYKPHQSLRCVINNVLLMHELEDHPMADLKADPLVLLKQYTTLVEITFQIEDMSASYIGRNLWNNWDEELNKYETFLEYFLENNRANNRS